MEYYNMLLPLAIILIVSKLLAKACTKFNLPTVVGLLITGLLMSLIRYIPGQTILDATALDGIGFLAKIGVILIMFETGLETDVKQLRDVGVGAVIISVVYDMGSSIVKSKDVVLILIMALAFVANYFFAVNVIYIILIVIVIGLVRTLIRERRKGARG